MFRKKSTMESTPIDTLTDLRDTVYGGSWSKMLDDLRARVDRKPYNHKIVTQIKADIEAIEKIFVKTQR